MSYTERLRIWYNDESIIGLLKAAWVAVVYISPVGKLIEILMGERMHEKLVRAPRLGYWPSIKNPRSFNEHILHRKLYVDHDLFVTVSDKWLVRQYVDSRIEEDILTDVFHVTDDPESICFNSLPESFVLKANHGCGWVEIIENKSTIDTDKILAQCEQWLSDTYGKRQREKWYSEIEPKIIVEEYIDVPDRKAPLDYKFFVFDGDVKYIQVDIDRYSNHTRRIFDDEWNPQEFKIEYPLGPVVDKPDRLDDMIQIAEKLGKEFSAARVDLYQPDPQTIIFGEITLAHGSGGEKFHPVEYDFQFGSYWP